MPIASKVAFVADSTLGLCPEEALKQGIHVVPQQVIWGNRTLRDQLDITDEEVLDLLRRGERLSTSQVALEDLRSTYETLLQTHERVLSVHVSGHLSGTVATAMAVAREFGERVKVLDSWSLNGGLLLVLEEARRLLIRGVAWEHLEEAVAPYRERVRGYVLPETLIYLHRSGRISGLQRFMGGLLSILPVLEVKGGRVLAGPRVRGFKEGLRRLVELFRRDFPDGGLVYLAHAGNPEGARTLGEALRAEGVEVLGTLRAGAAVSVHAGPGTVALFAGPRG
ncbi:fatty acid-binding protein DegV [Thermus scotoductus]|uniref:Fatty acid-binding protein DegV n=1 Tax=Thermus scotoductus TaxID=37636 RepID=A0ABY0AI81_THESC|nr:DegV family protein [Thermus scotoductus]RTH19065.1 fatty acid-binding protein DegV [Thermus scotoductus]RTH35055.1 fatty acid-binding protein DegV [Thermus scotoductus]RTI07398.1 fatty acid-binding protein DegV [Thermus scotoductus]RTI15136.1 fatty acid-binding protein DegV [Thermus scotoductus]RTI23329.1 fatty acid-binding protein DegV [Thermus scotoductus]